MGKVIWEGWQTDVTNAAQAVGSMVILRDGKSVITLPGQVSPRTATCRHTEPNSDSRRGHLSRSDAAGPSFGSLSPERSAASIKRLV